MLTDDIILRRGKYS